MQVASTIIVVREDFTIPGASHESTHQADQPRDHKHRFFDLLRQSRPDVVVLNLTVTKGRGVETIQEVREQSAVPILVVCSSVDPRAPDYRSAGAADCLHPPVEITELNRSIRKVVQSEYSLESNRPEQSAQAASNAPAPHGEGYTFQGVTHRPDEQSLAGSERGPVRLTSAENEVLRHLASRSWTILSRAELAECAYREQSPDRPRDVGVVVNQLRKKLNMAGGPGAGLLLKTERRRGFMLAADVATFPLPQSGGAAVL